MKSSKLWIGAVLLIVLSIVLSACGEVRAESKADYFNGTAVVEYKQLRGSSTDDYLTLRMYEKGTYKVTFSYTPGKSTSGKLPQDFTFVVEDAPREKVITQHILPDYLRVTIEFNETTEFHDFK